MRKAYMRRRIFQEQKSEIEDLRCRRRLATIGLRRRETVKMDGWMMARGEAAAKTGAVAFCLSFKKKKEKETREKKPINQ